MPNRTDPQKINNKIMISKRQSEIECCSGGCSGGAAATVMVVEYLESTMSKDLLCKFPDNSVFDFDYSQSSIWSPLLSRNFHSDFNDSNSTSTDACGTTTTSCGLQFLMGKSSSSSSNDSSSNGCSSIQRKLSYDDEQGNKGGILLSNHNNKNMMILKKLRDKIKKKITTTTATFFNNLRIHRNNDTVMKTKKMKKKKQSKSFDLSPFKNGSSSSSCTPIPIKRWGKVLKTASKQFKKKTSNKKDYYHVHLHLSN